MKRCPKCNQVFRDELLKFCRLDGTKLEATSDTLDFGEAPTLRLVPGDLSAPDGLANTISHHSRRSQA